MYIKTLVATIALCVFVGGAIVFNNYSPDIPVEIVNKEYKTEQSKFIEIDDTNVHVLIEGPEDGDAIVFLHGMGSSLIAWKDVLNDLKGQFKVVSIDLPFHGLTGPAQIGACSPNDVAKFVVRVLSALNINDPFIVGSSWGGHIALELALSGEFNMRGMVLINSSGLESKVSTTNRMIETKFGQFIFRNFTSEWMIRRFLKQVFWDDSLVSDVLVKQVTTLNRREGNRKGSISCRKSALQHVFKESSQLSVIQTPTLIIWGAEDSWINVENAHKFSNFLTHSSLRIYEETGHVPMEEKPKEVAKDILEFIETQS